MKQKLDNQSDKDTLLMLQFMHGKNVMCTNGLFHILNDDHTEVYINRQTGDIDKRALYKTLVVLDKTIVARVINNKKVNFVVLDKYNFKCLYKTKGNIYYINENLICDKLDNDCIAISHTGRTLGKLDNCNSINHILGSFYITSSDKMYNDKVLYYNKHKDELEDLTFGKEYLIHRLDKQGTEVEVIQMYGGQYIYDFSTKIVKNKFTGKIEKETNLWKIV